MAEIDAEVLIQTEQADGAFRCHAFSGIPAARRSWIALVSSGSAAGRALVAALEEELTAILLGSSPAAEMKDIPCPVTPDAMHPSDYPNRRKVLVLVASADQALDDVAWYGNWESEQGESAVMTVLPTTLPFKQLVTPAVLQDPNHHLLRRVNASLWQTEITETIPGILARAEITTSQARIFISYRRVETLPLALQLFDALTHQGFEVFLDRFTIPPGYDFQRRLDQELADKSMVLLLEAQYIGVSKWTQHEIDFAKRNRLGLMSLTMPDVPPGAKLPAISFDARMDLDPANFTSAVKSVPDPDRGGAPSGQWQELDKATLEKAVAAVKAAHAAALFRRRHRLRADLVAELRNQQVQAEYSAIGPLRVKTAKAEHLLWLATRPPDTPDFRFLHSAHFARKPPAESRAILIGPQAALEPDRLELLKWLCSVTHCLSFDEGDLPAIARRVAESEWT